MAFSYTAALQDALAYAVWNVNYSTLSAAQKVQMDGTASAPVTWNGTNLGGVAQQAAIAIGSIAQYLEQAAATPQYSFPTPAFDSLFLAEAGLILAKTVRPDRVPQFQNDRERALDEAIDTYSRDIISSTSLAGQGITLAGIRSYVVDHCVKRANSSTGLRRRLWPSIAQIDAQTQWTLNFIWNKTPWHFRKRQVVVRLTSVDISTATWTEASKTLTSTSSFTNTNIGAGDRLIVTGGTSVIDGEYLVASRTSDNAIVLDSSLASTGGNLSAGDITGSLQTVKLDGMGTNESFDAVVSRQLFYQGDQVGGKMKWVDSSDLAEWKASNNEDLGTPRVFRFERVSLSDTLATSWHFSPFPDTDYTLRGAVLLSGPGTLSTAASLVTAISKFPLEFGTVIRDVVLARVLQAHGASDGDQMMRAALDQVDTLLPIYSDQGFASRQTEVEDVYGDHAAMRNGWY